MDFWAVFMVKFESNPIRYDLSLIASWIDPDSKVLGLGCGDGELLSFLKKQKQVKETGVEIEESKVAECIEKGLSVIQGDINEEVEDYKDNTFDYVILSQTLQQVYEPSQLIRSMLRIGKKCVVSFPNFSHWKVRTHLLLTGCAPVTNQLPYEWHDTPNIRVITLNDFRKFIKEMNYTIIKEAAINTDKQDKRGNIIKILPAMRATYGIFLLGKQS
jgi:methionine biosynthesis protein MetW